MSGGRDLPPPLARSAGGGKPPRAVRDPGCDLADDLSLTLKPIGVVRSPFVMREDAPRQATVGEAAHGTIVLRRTITAPDGRISGAQNLLKDLAGFSHLIVLYWFHHSRGWRPQIVPPRDAVKRGLFATRAPDRPNPLGFSIVRVVDVFGIRIDIVGHDLLDGTPVLDLKPYIPAYDSFPDARAGWVDGLVDPGPDHRLRSDPPNRRMRSPEPDI